MNRMNEFRSFCVLPDEESQAQIRIDYFFQVAKRTALEKLPDDPNWELRVRGLHHLPVETPTDDRVHQLLYCGRVIAAVHQTRTQTNYVQNDFFVDGEIFS